ncbi:Rrf2 family transcriptional regulator [bacterium]|nr:Rrf2 family transcriptional regulator [bacterium]
MTLKKSTRYALCAAMEMALADLDEAVTATRVAELYGIPGSVMAKVFQQLVRGRIAVGTRGQRGGYRLARDAGSVTMLDVIDAIEPRDGASGDGAFGDSAGARRLREVFDEVEELERTTFASISLATLARRG